MLLSSSARHAHAHSSLPRQRASRVAPTTTRPQPLLLHSTTTTTSRHSSCLRASSSASAAAEEQEDKADAAAAVALPPLAAVAAPQTQKQQPDSVPQYSDASSNSNTTTTNNNNVYTKARVRRLSRSWQDSSTPNTGIVAITDRSKVGGAAACVAADFKTSRITRIVPMSEDQTHRAVDTLRIAAQMFNDNSAMDSEAEGKQHVTQALSFQPVEIVGDLATPALPLGSTALYVSLLRADDETLQKVLVQRAAALEAAETAADDGASDSSSSSSSSSSSQQQHQPRVFVGRSSAHERVAKAVNNALDVNGWAELVCQGRTDQVMPVAMKALIKLRRIRFGVFKDDAAAILLGDEGILGHNGRSNAAAQEGLRPPISFLVLRCAKNYSNKLLELPAASS